MGDQHITAREGEQEGDGRDSKREIGVLNRIVKAPPGPEEGERDEAAAQAQPNEVEHIPERDADAKSLVSPFALERPERKADQVGEGRQDQCDEQPHHQGHREGRHQGR